MSPDPSFRPLRVLMLSHGSQSRTEGQPKAVLLGRLPDIELRVLTPRWWKDYGVWRAPEEPVEKSFDLRPSRVRFPWLGPAQSYLHYYPDLARDVAEFRPDVINVWEEPWSLVSAQAIRVRDRVLPRAKVICETEQNIFKPLPFPFRQIRRYVLGRVDGMVGRSREAIEVLRTLGYTGRADLVPNAVDTDLFKPTDRAACRAQLRSELGVDWSEKFVVGFVGRLVPEKGIADLIEAIELCPDDVVLLVVGSGPMDGDLRTMLTAAKLEHRSVVVPARPLAELPRLFGAMDLLAVPSRTTPRWKEQFGRVIIEAHACGIPVIGSSSGAIAEVIGSGGLVFEERRPSEIAAAIRSVRADPKLGGRLSAEGFAQTTRVYTWAAVAEKMRRIFREVGVLSGEKNA